MVSSGVGGAAKIAEKEVKWFRERGHPAIFGLMLISIRPSTRTDMASPRLHSLVSFGTERKLRELEPLLCARSNFHNFITRKQTKGRASTLIRPSTTLQQ